MHREQELADTDLLNWFFQHSLSARTAGIFVCNSASLSDKEWLDEGNNAAGAIIEESI